MLLILESPAALGFLIKCQDPLISSGQHLYQIEVCAHRGLEVDEDSSKSGNWVFKYIRSTVSVLCKYRCSAIPGILVRLPQPSSDCAKHFLFRHPTTPPGGSSSSRLEEWKNKQDYPSWYPNQGWGKTGSHQRKNTTKGLRFKHKTNRCSCLRFSHQSACYDNNTQSLFRAGGS